MVAPTLEHCTVKCCLGSLLPHNALRKGLQQLPVDMQTLAVRASHLANHCALDLLQRDLDVGDIFEQKWWHNVLTRFTVCRNGGSAQCAYPMMTEALESFAQVHRLEPVQGDMLWSFIAEMARDLLTSAKVMVARALYIQLAKYVSRLVSQWELDEGRRRGSKARFPLPKGMPYAAKRYFFQEFFGAKRSNRWRLPESFPQELQDVLRKKSLACKARYPNVGAECGFADKIKTQHLPHILRLEYELLQDRRSCLDQLMRDRVCDERTACGLFRKGCLTGSALLPFSSYDVKYVALTPSSLRELVKLCLDRFGDEHKREDKQELMAKKEEILAEQRKTRRHGVEVNAARHRRDEGGEPERKRRKLEGNELHDRKRFNRALFDWAFPGLSRIKRSRHAFADHIATDGVGCSVLFTSPQARHSRASGASCILKEEGRDLNARCPPVVLNSEDKLIGVDPGRRDMIVAYEAASGSVLKMTTKQHTHESGRTRKARATCRTLRRVSCQLPGYACSTLLRQAQNMPTRKETDSLRWLRYLSHALPLMDARCQAHRRRQLRRHRIENYMKRDQSLDLLCQRLLRLGGTPRGQGRVCIAFGDGSRCSTGFGYSPAPQARLRHRLSTLHGARVTLVHEAYTSQTCSRCFSELDQKRICGVDVHGVKVCRHCCATGRHPLHWHRDVNAARNMVAIYEHLAKTGTRPACFNRSA